MSGVTQARSVIAWTAAALLIAVVVAWAAASPASGGPSPIIITRAPDCSTTCTAFSFSFTNTGSVPINGLTIQAAPPNQILTFSVAGQPPAIPTGVQNAFAIYPAAIAAGVTIEGGGTVSTALGASDTFKVFTTSDSFNTVTGVDVPLTLPTTPVASHASITGLDVSYFQLGFALGGKFFINYRVASTGTVNEEEHTKLHPRQRVRRPPQLEKEVFEGELEGPGPVVVAVDPPAAAHQCRWMINNQANFRVQGCDKPIWLPAVVTGRTWSFTITRPLPVGHYVIESRAAGETIFTAGRHNRVTLTVRP